MLYPPLEEGHEVLGLEYCSGYSDIHQKWNSGFYCPLIIPDVPVYCCGTAVLKYCCTIGKGGRYTKSDTDKTDTDLPDKDSDDEIPETPNLSSEPEAFSHQSLLIGITCGLVAMAALITIVSCFYCSCCLLYKKRTGSQLSGSELLYGIPPTSTTLTTCGVLNYSGAAPAENTVVETSAGNHSGGICRSAAVNPTCAPLQTLIATSAPLNPTVDYWSSNGGSSNSSSVGVTTEGGPSSAVVMDTVTSLCPPNLVGGSVPHHILHSSVYHHFTASSPMDAGGGTVIMSPIQHLEPPPPYLAVAAPNFGQVSYCDSTNGGIIPGTRTPQRTNSRGSSSGGSCGQRANLTRRHLLLLQHHDPIENNNVNNAPDNACQGNNNVASTSIGATERESNNNNSSTSGRGNLPPPYFVEQYRIRNRVRPPQFQTNPHNNGSSSFNNNLNQRNRAQETIQNLLYPLLNSTNLSTTLSARSQNEGRRRVNVPLDTRSEPRRVSRQNYSRNVGCSAVDWGTRLHRSSSDRQQNIDNSLHCCYMGAETSGNYSAGVGRMNNLNNNLSVRTNADRNGRASGTTSDMLTGESSGSSAVMRRYEVASEERAGDTGSSVSRIGNTGKILNTEMVQRQTRLQRCPGDGSAGRAGRAYFLESHESSPIISPTSSAPYFESQRHCDDVRQEFVQIDSTTTSTPSSRQTCDIGNSIRDVSLEGRSESPLNEREMTRAIMKPTANHSGNGIIEDDDDDDDDADDILMDDEDDEVIAVVTTTRLHQQNKEGVDEAAAVISVNDLEMGFGQEEYLGEEENSEENSIEKLSESATNSSMSNNAEFNVDHCTDEGQGSENSKVASGTPSNFFPVREGSED